MLNKLNINKSPSKLEKAKMKLVQAIDGDIQTTQKNIDEMCEILSDFQKNKYSKHDSFFNLCIFSDIFLIDLTILLEKIRISNREQEKKLYARVIAVTIIDFLDNINVLIGRDCLLELKNNNMTEFIDEFKLINKNFSNFRKENEKILRDIRNNAIAHKSKDALKLNNFINNINVEVVYEFGLELKIYSNDFIDLSTKIAQYIVRYMKAGRKI